MLCTNASLFLAIPAEFEIFEEEWDKEFVPEPAIEASDLREEEAGCEVHPAPQEEAPVEQEAAHRDRPRDRKCLGFQSVGALASVNWSANLQAAYCTLQAASCALQ